MKYLNKSIVFFVFMLFSYGVDTFAYTYRITNMTDFDVKVQLHYRFGKLGPPRIIKAGKTHKFSFTFPNPRFGLCLTKIKVVGQSGKIKVGPLCKSAKFILGRHSIFGMYVNRKGANTIYASKL